MSGYSKIFPSELHNVRLILSESIKFIRDYVSLSKQDENDLRLIFSELLFNAVIHGNKSDVNKKVYFQLEVLDEHVACIISDEGMGFDHKEVIDSFFGEGELMNEHGRGIRLAQCLCDKFSYNVLGNEVRLVKKIKTEHIKDVL